MASTELDHRRRVRSWKLREGLVGFFWSPSIVLYPYPETAVDYQERLLLIRGQEGAERCNCDQLLREVKKKKSDQDYLFISEVRRQHFSLLRKVNKYLPHLDDFKVINITINLNVDTPSTGNYRSLFTSFPNHHSPLASL